MQGEAHLMLSAISIELADRSSSHNDRAWTLQALLMLPGTIMVAVVSPHEQEVALDCSSQCH